MPKLAKTLLKIAVSAGLMCILYSRLDWSDLAEKLRGADIRWLGLSLCFMFLNTAVSAVKWGVFLRVDGLHQGFASLWCSYITASFFNLFLPSTIGGDAYRIADIGGRTGEHTRVAASILADRASGFFALSLYGCGAALLVRSLVPAWQWWFPLPSFAALAALSVLGVSICSSQLADFVVRLIPGAQLRGRIVSLAAKISGALRLYAGKPSVAVAAIALSFLFQLNLILAVWAITKAIGLAFPLPVFFLFLPIKTFIEMIPLSVFGLGLRDLGYGIFTKAMGLGSTAVACAALVSAAEVLLTVLYSSLGGLVFAIRSRQCKRRS